MEPHHETGFPTTLCRWVGEIAQSSPEAARLTFLELIVGARRRRVAMSRKRSWF